MTIARPAFEGDEAGRCGGCGSRAIDRLKTCSERALGLCRDCGRFQEIEERDWPESEMCGNCAFRRGSPERADAYRWAEIEETLRTGQRFHCHKGLAYDWGTGRFSAPSPEAGRVTVCAGWLAAYIAQFRRSDRKC